jgi:diadenosine tetraphosphate (Ap4A) HIT family hydrolase
LLDLFSLKYAGRLNSCPFCAVEPERISIANENALAFLDAFPIAEGHTLVAPRKHVSSIYELSTTEQRAIWELVGRVREQLIAKFNPDGFNIGFNDGLAAGQTVSHAHVHIIPRRTGDVPDPRGGIRWVIADKAPYWKP